MMMGKLIQESGESYSCSTVLYINTIWGHVSMELNCVQTMSKSKVYVHGTTLRPQNAEQLRENGERTVVEILYCTSISHGAQLLYVRTTGCPTRLRSHYFSGGGTTTWLSVFLIPWAGELHCVALWTRFVFVRYACVAY